MQKLAILLCFVCVAWCNDVDSYIKQNSENFSNTSKIKRVYASTPTLLYLLYAVSRHSIVGLNYEFNELERPYLDKKVIDQEVVGGFFGKAKIPNSEKLLALSPDLILANNNVKQLGKLREIFTHVKKPILYFELKNLDDYIAAIEILGEVLDKKQRANELIKYAKQSLELKDRVQDVIAKHSLKKPRVYYAQGFDGLLSECEGSPHALLIALSGANNVHKCENISEYGRVKLSFEQVLTYQPDVILVYEKSFYDRIFTDKKWSLLKAVKDKKVYLIPRKPFSWFDRPPSFMRFLGLRWLVSLNYNEYFDIDMVSETIEFYKLFLDVNLTQEQAKEILAK